MAIKQFIFSFKLDAKDLLEYVTERNVAVTIDAYGTPPKVPKQKQLQAPSKTLALPPPTPRKPGTRKSGAKDTMLAFLVTHKKESVARAMLNELLIQQGYSKFTLNSAIWTLRNDGFVKFMSKGKYRATAKAVKFMEANNG